MCDSFRLTLGWFGDTPVLQLAGALIFFQKLRLIHDTVTRLARDGHARLVIDMTEVDMTDSSGISALLDVRQVIGHDTGCVLLLRPSPRVQSALDLLHVTSLFEVVDSEAELVRSLGPRRTTRSSDTR